MFETLEDRIVPAQYLWTNGSTDGLWSNAANWTDLASGPSAVPGSGDYAVFGSGGSITASTMNISSRTVDRVIMDSSYTATLTINSGNVLTTTNQFVQYGSLDLPGPGSLVVGTSFYGNGTIFDSPGFGTAASIGASGSFYLNAGASITTTASPSFGGSLTIASAGFDGGGTINAGNSTTAGALIIAGPVTQLSGAVANIYSGSSLSFTTNGITGAHATLKGTVNLGAGTSPTGGASISSASQLYLDGGTLISTGSSANSMAGDIGVYNSGVIDIGDGTFGNTLAHSAGSLTVGAQNPSGTATGGTANIKTGSILSFPAATNTSTFVVMSQGQVNMYGAIIAMDTSRVSVMDIRAGGLLSTSGAYGGSSGFPQVGDAITGNVLNNGLLEYLGNLHALNIYANMGAGGNYTQGSTGELSVRLKNSAACDALVVGGTATLNGTLSVDDLETLTAGQTWIILDPQGGISGDFSTKTLPGSTPPWGAGFNGVTAKYEVVN